MIVETALLLMMWAPTTGLKEVAGWRSIAYAAVLDVKPSDRHYLYRAECSAEFLTEYGFLSEVWCSFPTPCEKTVELPFVHMWFLGAMDSPMTPAPIPSSVRDYLLDDCPEMLTERSLARAVADRNEAQPW